MKPHQFASLNPRVVLAVGAHPDDIDFGAAGSLALFARAGADIYYLQLTDGGSGSSDPDAKGKQVAKQRQHEQYAACECIGGKDVEFLNFPDGKLENTLEVKTCIVKTIRRLKPDIVITTDPSFIYSAELGIINHPDHRAAGQATLDAVYPLARDRLTLPKLQKAGLRPHKVSTVLLLNFNEQNYHIDITDVLDCKIQAMLSHASQVPDPQAMTDLLIHQAERMGANSNCHYAEGFMRIDVIS